IGAVDHSDAHIFTRQFFRRLEPAKTRANDDDARFSCEGVFHAASFRQRSTSNAQRPTFNSLLGATAWLGGQKVIVKISRRIIFATLCRSQLREAKHVKQ